MSKDLNQRIRDASFGNAGPAIETSVDFREAIHDQGPIGKPESTNWIRISPMDPAPWARHEAALRAELIRLEQSHPIATSPKLRQLLRYLFAETVAGRGEQLSQYGIAFDCYMLGDRYDSASNTLVRTHARRLRRILNELAPANGSARILMRERGYQLVLETALDVFPLAGAGHQPIRLPVLGILEFEIMSAENVPLHLCRSLAAELMMELADLRAVEVVGPVPRALRANLKNTVKELNKWGQVSHFNKTGMTMPWSVPRKSWTGNKDGRRRHRVTSARREWAPPRLVGAGRGRTGFDAPIAVNPNPIHSHP